VSRKWSPGVEVSGMTLCLKNKRKVDKQMNSGVKSKHLSNVTKEANGIILLRLGETVASAMKKLQLYDCLLHEIF
jgi:hypothetical protein